MRTMIVAAVLGAAGCAGRLIPTEVVSSGRPVYPDSLRAQGIEGRVIVQVIVDTAGRVEPGSAAVVRSPHAGFDQAAIDFVYAARFRPARQDGRLVRAVVDVPIDFKLDRRGPGDVFRADQVDQAPTIVAAEPPAYPSDVKTARVDVRVVVSAVIDTLGRAEPGSLRIVSSPGAAFEQGARTYVLGARFWPGLVAGRKVRVLIDVPVDFSAH